MSRRRSGFTLLELLLASVLMTLMLLAVTAILTRFAEDPTLASAGSGSARGGMHLEALFDLLERDLAMADVIRWESDGSLVLEGLVGLDGVTRERRDLPAVVRYVLVEQGDGRVLLRVQRGLEGGVLTDVVGWGVGRVLLEPGLKRSEMVQNGAETGAQVGGYPVIDLDSGEAGRLFVRDDRMFEMLTTVYSAASAWRIRLYSEGAGVVMVDRWAVLR